MDARELRNGCGRARRAVCPPLEREEKVVIFVALPFIAVLFGVAPQFVGGVILWMLAVAPAGYAMAQLIWEAASAS